MLRTVPVLTGLVMLGPVLAGLAGAVLPSFGYLPAAGLTELSLDPWRELMAWPGLGQAVWLSVFTGIMATGLSLGLVILITAGWSGTRVFRAMQRLLSPLLSVPHAAAAFGIAFLIAPSGWIARALSPGLTGWERPPDLLIVNDSAGWSLIAGLVVKEVPFLMLMTLAALGQVQQEQRLKTARALGYRRVTGWLKAVFPAVYAQIRLPVYVVLAFSMSVVDVALILGPTTPSTLAVQIVDWMNAPALEERLIASAGAILQLGLVIGALALWRGMEAVCARLGHVWVDFGGRGGIDGAAAGVAIGAGVLIWGAMILGLASLALWSFAGFWSFPDVLPDGLGLRTWDRHGEDALATMGQTFLVAGLSVLVAIALVIGCLEAEYRSGRRMTRTGQWILYLPLLVPQVAFLPGLQTLLLAFGADKGLAPVVFAHLIFVLPYVFLSLGDPWRAWDARMGTVAATLGARPARVLWTVRMPMLLRPVLTALAVGVAVSVGQYLPTLLIGGGRVSTLTTEALALTSGGDRRAIGLYGLMQTLAALLPFLAALVIPALVWRNRRRLHV